MRNEDGLQVQVMEPKTHGTRSKVMNSFVLKTQT